MAKVEIDDVAADQAKAEDSAASKGAEKPEAADKASAVEEGAGAECESPKEADDGVDAGAVDVDAGDKGIGEDDAAEADADADAKAGDGEPIVEPDTDAMMQAAAEALTKAQAEAAEWQDKYLRLHAEWDTYRRRTNEQREAERARAAEKLVTSLLPVIDDFERTIDYAEQNGEGELLSGVQAVHTKLVDVLSRDGVIVIDPVGEAFDALECQAVATVEDDSVFDETVAQVYQKGYKMGSKVLRPAMVTVTTGGPKREKPDSAEGEADADTGADAGEQE